MEGQGSFAATTKRERGPTEPRGERKPGGPAGRAGGPDRKFGGGERKGGGPDRKHGTPERKFGGAEGRPAEGKPAGKKPYKGKSNSFKGDAKGDGRALAGKWTGKKKGSAPN
jgi:hypothetical protein